MKNNRGFIVRAFSPQVMRGLAVMLLLSLVTEIFYPTCAWALTGGPSQPEVQGFEPVGTSDMVDMFTGDFTYNIPLLDVDGYPINISYHSGISMDDEASWVGLGWSLNAGVINRNVRGLPDDFNGDAITKNMNMKPNRTFGLSGGVDTEIFGKKLGKLKIGGDTNTVKAGLGIKLGFNYNNYRGMGTELSVNLSLSATMPGKGKMGANLGLTSSSENGLTFAPSLSFEANIKTSDSRAGGSGSNSLGLNIGTAVNNRSGLKQLSITTSIKSNTESKFKGMKNTTESSATVGGTSSVFSFGSATYTPTGGPNMNNLSITGNFKFGAEAFGADATYNISGYYSQQKLASKTVTNNAYGYMNHEAGMGNENALFDFNRENDGGFSENTPALPLAQQTFDTWSVAGQGVGGSYRPVRSDMGYVHDAMSYTTSEGYDIGVEVGLTAINHNGGDFTVTSNNTTTGMWNGENLAQYYLQAKASTGNKTYEKYFFKEANEKTIEGDEFYNKVGEAQAARLELLDNGNFNVVAGKRLQTKTGGYYNLPNNTRSQREKRNQVIYALTRGEVYNGAGLNSLVSASYSATAPDHHISEITTYSTDGSRYVYGLPAYNTSQKEISFAVGARPNSSDGLTGDCATGLVTYGGSDNSENNDRGLDNYYSSTHTPAFAHSYLLTAVLSPDYIDSDNIKGPSENDMGYYTRFVYKKISGYKWRTPYTKTVNQASYNEGLVTDKNDDKASVIYGEKELWYLDTIVTKNYIAIFHTSDREDGLEAGGENGGVGSLKTKKLDKISLYSRWDYKNNPATAVPIKEVHFVYEYALCPGIPNHSATVTTGSVVYDPVETDRPINGKLTLKEIYFTYQNSYKAKFSAYRFDYGVKDATKNPAYSYKAYDRWGNYKPVPVGSVCDSLLPAEFPYVTQNKTLADQYSSVWHLREIRLPSGGKIKVHYESDDYAYVQHKKAMQMFRIAGYEGNTMGTNVVDISIPGKRIYFPLVSGETNINDYFAGVNRVYFRFLMYTNTPDDHDYVSGYFNIQSYGVENVGGILYGYVIPKSVEINDDGPYYVNPITKAALQFGRLNFPRLIYNQPAIADSDSFGENLLNSLVSIVSNFAQAIKGENAWILEKNKCKYASLRKSWIRLTNPNERKLGGGCRVKKIEMTDEWAGMTNNAMKGANYGQEYFYTNEDGSSSGVASYEPQLGGDENVWKQPIFTQEKNLMAQDNEHYMEEPFGESLFPGAGVGYSRVTVRNLQRANVTRHATGKVVHEFYTARDFPTIVEHTGVKPIQDKTDPFSLTSIFKVKSKDFMTASQGFSVELNDMHGKPKKQSVYQEGKPEPITSVEYRYKSSPYLTGSQRLNSKVSVIGPDGSITEKNVGLVFDMTTDFRQQRTELNSCATQANLDGFMWPFPPVYIPVPMFLPQFTNEITQFRSVVVTKVTQRFGILEETIAKDLGSIVSTKNLAYDSETGEVLLTQTTTDFNDAIYSMTYPAHWYYDGMGQAYKNIGLTQSAVSFSSGTASIVNADRYFVPGDVLQMKTGSTFVTGWVVNVTSNTISVVKKDGSAITGSYQFKVIRSGRRNLQSTPIATLTSLSNPLTNFTSNVYEKVLQASAVEFSDRWRTFCDCFDHEGSPMEASSNPYIQGTRGNWRMKTSFLHLSPRSQSYYNNNTNIRKDGVFTSYTPYYRLNGGRWQVDEKNWTYTSEVTEFSPYGQELENRDALGRYSAATFGYKQAFATGVAANARYRDIGFDNFEDYGFSKCADQHFKFPVGSGIVQTESHSGRRSLKVAGGETVVMAKALQVCDPVGCNLDISATHLSGTVTDIDITGGSAPYQIDWNVVSGNPSIKFDGANFNSLISTGSGYSVEIIVLDSKGCKITKQVEH